ncbi:glycogen/starch/alpha-glucan phosphorylases [Thermosinus carboxydivorans Nor1]|uniref:Alpha-1,4 glucan phosphorylase n=1 Tax=Thermosinus carboxydivorans Nor1 TaxID=401526 RepID=A1HNU3_9FIRM|nr:glycogen/starch/alpha-glucan phosphorylases [Thermosinus carboxydivorans Nor1]
MAPTANCIFTRPSADKAMLRQQFIDRLAALYGKTLDEASELDIYNVIASMVREEINRRWAVTNRYYKERKVKQVYYFSMEFLIGRLLTANMLNLGIYGLYKEALAELGVDIDRIEQQEQDAGLGNGGLGRLAACFLDSLACMNYAGHGCGIRYKYGLFEQKIIDGHQFELPDNWLKEGYPWEVRKADKAVTVRFGGQVRLEESGGRLVAVHENYEAVKAVPYDIPVVGCNNKTVNTLRLWSAETDKPDFDFSTFSRGNYLKAMEYKYAVEAISQILYPDDTYQEGRLLRLKQQYFLVSAGLQSIVRRYKKLGENLHFLPDYVAIHINDTHPALVVPELMRILMDEEGLGWDEAWRITTGCVFYTNHTVMPEALEKWPTDMLRSLLPRIYMIIEEINERFCRELWRSYPGDWERIRRMAVIADNMVHMANLAVVGSASVNGVAKIHTEILKKDVFKLFYEYCPHKFNNKTNGVTHRRWLAKANPLLARLLDETIGPAWLNHPEDLVFLHPYASDPAFQARFAKVKQFNKERLAAYIQDRLGLAIDPCSIFDIQVKRIHAYKRQLLNILHILHLYDRLTAQPDLDIVPRTFIFAGKAAPGYYFAKRIIKLINDVAALVNSDKRICDKLKVVFLENYNVSLAELIIPAADLSEQISTASREASGTGNMKFMMNGAITIGTLDGANIEIKEAVGDDNIIIFGLTAGEVLNYYKNGGYNAWQEYHGDKRVKAVLDRLLTWEDSRLIYDTVLNNNDEFFVLKDFSTYIEAQERAAKYYQDSGKWWNMAIHNVAYAGYFSSDRTIAEYAIGLWRLNRAVIVDSGGQ